MARLIIIDDDPIFIDVFKSLLGQDNEVVGATSSDEGIEKIRNEEFDILVVDFFIDANNGKDVVEKIRRFNKEIYILMLTAYRNEAPGNEILEKVDVQNYCYKDSKDWDNVLLTIKSAIKSVEHFKQIDSKKSNGNISERMKTLRKLCKISQTELANKLNIKRTSITNYEAGVSEPSIETIKKMAKVFGVTTDYLLGYVPDFDEGLINKQGSEQ